MPITIYDTQSTPRLTIEPGEGSLQRRYLMEEDYVELRFSTGEPVPFKLGDWCEVEGKRYELADPYYPAFNTSTGGFDYTLRLDAYYCKWKNKLLFYDRQHALEASWQMTGFPGQFLSIVCSNLAALGYTCGGEGFTYETDGSVPEEARLCSFSGTNIWDALSVIAEAFGCEWWVDGSVIRLGHCEREYEVDGLPLIADFYTEKEVDGQRTAGNILNMAESKSQEGYATRIIPFGSTDNLPNTYGKQLIFTDTSQSASSEMAIDKPLDASCFAASTLDRGAEIALSSLPVTDMPGEKGNDTLPVHSMSFSLPAPSPDGGQDAHFYQTELSLTLSASSLPVFMDAAFIVEYEDASGKTLLASAPLVPSGQGWSSEIDTVSRVRLTPGGNFLISLQWSANTDDGEEEEGTAQPSASVSGVLHAQGTYRKKVSSMDMAYPLHFYPTISSKPLGGLEEVVSDRDKRVTYTLGYSTDETRLGYHFMQGVNGKPLPPGIYRLEAAEDGCALNLSFFQADGSVSLPRDLSVSIELHGTASQGAGKAAVHRSYVLARIESGSILQSVPDGEATVNIPACSAVVPEDEVSIGSGMLEDCYLMFRISIQQYDGMDTGISRSGSFRFYSTTGERKVEVSFLSGAVRATGSTEWADAAGKTATAVFQDAGQSADGRYGTITVSGYEVSPGSTFEITSGLLGNKVPLSYFTEEDYADGLVVDGVVQRRLHLPRERTEAVLAYEEEAGISHPEITQGYFDVRPNLPTDEIVEAIVTFDKVKPTASGTLTYVSGPDVESSTEGNVTTYSYYYRVKDANLTGFSNDYLLSGQSFTLHFNSGKLAGREFEATYHEGTSEFELMPADEGGISVPNDILFPSVGDKYAISAGLDASAFHMGSTSLVPAAELELYKAVVEYAGKLSVSPSVFDCEMWKQSDHSERIYEVGQKVRLTSPLFLDCADHSRMSRIIGYEKAIDKSSCTYFVGKSLEYSRIGALESRVEELVYDGQRYALTSSSGGTGGQKTYIIKTGDSRSASDENVYSALRSREEFLSKKQDDRTSGKVTFGGGFESESDGSIHGNMTVGGSSDLKGDAVLHSSLDVKGDTLLEGEATAKGTLAAEGGVRIGESYVPGLLGRGGYIDRNGNAVLRSLELWESLTVPELRYNRVTAYAGIRWDTVGAGTVESVSVGGDGLSGSCTLKLEEGEIGLVSENDLCMGIWHDTSGNAASSSDDRRGNFAFAGFKTVCFQVTSVPGTDGQGRGNADRHYFTYTLRPGTSAHPSSGMGFAARGNTTDPSRQAFAYTTTEYSVLMAGVNQWEFTDAMYVGVTGKLEGFTINGRELHGYGQYFGNAYVYGRIDQFEKMADSMRLSDTLGGFMREGETDTLLCSVHDGYGRNVTASYGGWQITRTTTDAASDAAWNAAATAPEVVDTGSGPAARYDIAFADLGAGSHATFTFAATDAQGNLLSVSTAFG